MCSDKTNENAFRIDFRDKIPVKKCVYDNILQKTVLEFFRNIKTLQLFKIRLLRTFDNKLNILRIIKCRLDYLRNVVIYSMTVMTVF